MCRSLEVGQRAHDGTLGEAKTSEANPKAIFQHIVNRGLLCILYGDEEKRIIIIIVLFFNSLSCVQKCKPKIDHANEQNVP
jgi:hypothetical protein